MTTTSLDYYDGPEILDELEDALRQAGLDPDALDVDDLAALDEFHARGRAATVALAELAGVRRGERVLDVGAGIGGPARFLAARYGADVTALDATPRFSAACERLTRSARLTDVRSAGTHWRCRFPTPASTSRGPRPWPRTSRPRIAS